MKKGLARKTAQGLCLPGSPGRIRTNDLVINSHPLYPAELPGKFQAAYCGQLDCFRQVLFQQYSLIPRNRQACAPCFLARHVRPCAAALHFACRIRLLAGVAGLCYTGVRCCLSNMKKRRGGPRRLSLLIPWPGWSGSWLLEAILEDFVFRLLSFSKVGHYSTVCGDRVGYKDVPAARAAAAAGNVINVISRIGSQYECGGFAYVDRLVNRRNSSLAGTHTGADCPGNFRLIDKVGNDVTVCGNRIGDKLVAIECAAAAAGDLLDLVAGSRNQAEGCCLAFIHCLVGVR